MTGRIELETLISSLNNRINDLTDLKSNTKATINGINRNFFDFFTGIDSGYLSIENPEELMKLNLLFSRMHEIGHKKAQKLKLIYGPPKVVFERKKGKKVKIRIMTAEGITTTIPAPSTKMPTTPADAKIQAPTGASKKVQETSEQLKNILREAPTEEGTSHQKESTSSPKGQQKSGLTSSKLIKQQKRAEDISTRLYPKLNNLFGELKGSELKMPKIVISEDHLLTSQGKVSPDTVGKYRFSDNSITLGPVQRVESLSDQELSRIIGHEMGHGVIDQSDMGSTTLHFKEAFAEVIGTYAAGEFKNSKGLATGIADNISKKAAASLDDARLYQVVFDSVGKRFQEPKSKTYTSLGQDSDFMYELSSSVRTDYLLYNANVLEAAKMLSERLDMSLAEIIKLSGKNPQRFNKRLAYQDKGREEIRLDNKNTVAKWLGSKEKLQEVSPTASSLNSIIDSKTDIDWTMKLLSDLRSEADMLLLKTT